MKNKRLSMLPWKHIAIGATALASSLSTANAAINLNFEYDPSANSGAGSVVAEFSGSWDVGHMVSLSGDFLFSDDVQFLSLSGDFDYGDGGIDGDNPWGIGQFWDERTGDIFGFDTFNVYGPTGFETDTVITGTMTRGGSLTDLGFANDLGGLSGVLTGAGGTVNWSTSVVPEPSATGLVVSTLVLLWVAGRRRYVR